MFKILGKLPREPFVACSGGPDSMAVVSFLRRTRPVRILHFNHGTEHGMEAEEFVKKYCFDNNIELFVGKKDREREGNESPEEYWRKLRYSFFYKFKEPIVMCHNLDDQVEQWVFSSLRSSPKLIPYKHGKYIIRPFMLNKKEEFVDWCKKHNVPYIVDPSNNSLKYSRSYIRTKMMDDILHINPGIHTMIRKKVSKLEL